MNWKYLRHLSWLDTRARFVNRTPAGGTLLDVGSGDGETLGHFAELRPDLKLFATDLAGKPENYPSGCMFHRGDIQCNRLPWPAGSMDTITCLHLVEHLTSLDVLFEEAARLLKPGGRIFIETPHLKTVVLPSLPGDWAGTFPMSFYDDGGHVKHGCNGAFANAARPKGFKIISTGTSRNWLFAASYPFFFSRRPPGKNILLNFISLVGRPFSLLNAGNVRVSNTFPSRHRVNSASQLTNGCYRERTAHRNCWMRSDIFSSRKAGRGF